jgi:hypothetical protein
VRQQSRSIMPGWVWANAQAGGARIDTGKVWTLTVYAHLRASPAMVLKHAKLRVRSTTDLRVYGFPQNRKTASADSRKSVKA